MKVKSFEDLTVGQEAHKLTLEVYKLTQSFPGAKNMASYRNCGAAVLLFQQILPKDLAGLGQGNCCAAFRLRAES